MRPIAELAGLVRRAASATLALLLLLATPALAGDRALLNIIGYSEDARYFAFEEYGVQDGSGFAYSNIYIVDLTTDAWISGTPFQAAADDASYDRPLAEVRTEAQQKAAAQIAALGISVPGEIYALLGDGVPDADGKEMKFAEPLCCGPGQVQEPVYTLSLETFAVTPTEDYCADMNPVGYALSFTDGEASVELHRDGATLPKSRGCTLDYRLYAVIERFESFEGRVAIISSYPFGFEGPDRRFLAVPIHW